MRKVFLDNLPRGGGIVNKNSINWTDSIGYKIKFIYDDLEGDFEITNYNKINRAITLKYNQVEKLIKTPHLLKNGIGSILDFVILQYRYECGDIIKTITGEIKILEQTKTNRYNFNIKSYKYQCLKDSYIGNITEDDLKKGIGCPICSNKKIIKGVNDVYTTHPHLLKYFVDIEDSHKYTYGSKKMIKMKCPDCGFEKELNLNILTKQGFGCAKCSDGISYPEKFMFNILVQLHIDFITQKVFKWLYNKKYDFYIESVDCIIETHGLQHYENKIKIYGKSSEEEQDNDDFKEMMGRFHEIKHYISLDCKYSNLEYIKKSVLTSELNDLFDLSKIDWLKCHEFACSSRVKEASDLWNSGIKNTKEISAIMKITRPNITKYLKNGSILGWNNYNPEEEMKKNWTRDRTKDKRSNIQKIKIFKEGVLIGVYNSITELISEYKNSYNISLSRPKISEVCNKKRPNHKGFYFEYVK